MHQLRHRYSNYVGPIPFHEDLDFGVTVLPRLKIQSSVGLSYLYN